MLVNKSQSSCDEPLLPVDLWPTFASGDCTNRNAYIRKFRLAGKLCVPYLAFYERLRPSCIIFIQNICKYLPFPMSLGWWQSQSFENNHCWCYNIRCWGIQMMQKLSYGIEFPKFTTTCRQLMCSLGPQQMSKLMFWNWIVYSRWNFIWSTNNRAAVTVKPSIYLLRVFAMRSRVCLNKTLGLKYCSSTRKVHYLHRWVNSKSCKTCSLLNIKSLENEKSVKCHFPSQISTKTFCSCQTNSSLCGKYHGQMWLNSTADMIPACLAKSDTKIMVLANLVRFVYINLIVWSCLLSPNGKSCCNLRGLYVQI